MELDVGELVDLYFHQTLDHLDAPQLIRDMVDFFRRNNLVIPADLFALGRCIVLLQGDGEILDPESTPTLKLCPGFSFILGSRISDDEKYAGSMGRYPGKDLRG